MSERISSNPHTEEEFSLPLFLFVVALSFGGSPRPGLAALPHSVWHAQVGGPLWKVLAAFLAFSLFNCFMEYFFHRYVLHKRWRLPQLFLQAAHPPPQPDAHHPPPDARRPGG